MSALSKRTIEKMFKAKMARSIILRGVQHSQEVPGEGEQGPESPSLGESQESQ